MQLMRTNTKRNCLLWCVLTLEAVFGGTQQVMAQKQRLFDSLIRAAVSAQTDTIRAKLLNSIANRYEEINLDSAIHYALKSLAVAEKADWNKGKAIAFNTLGVCEVFKANYAKGTEYWNRGLKIYQEMNDKKGMLIIIGNFGNLYVFQADYARALEQNFLALKYAEETGDKMSIAINYGNIASAYEYLDEHDKAIKYNLMALKGYQELQDTPDVALVCGNLGNTYMSKHLFNEALSYQQRALATHNRLEDKESIARDLLNIGNIYNNLHQYSKALASYFSGLDNARQIDFRTVQANILMSIGEVYTFLAKDSVAAAQDAIIPQEMRARYSIPSDKKGFLNTAIKLIREGLAIDSAANNPAGLAHGYKYLADAQGDAGLLAEALKSKDNFIRFNDSVYATGARVKVANLETRRELELKDKQIEIDHLAVAKKRNERGFFIAGIILMLVVIGAVFRNMKLRSARELSENKLNAFQARMNPHFIFNSLNSIQSLVLNNETINSIKYLSEFSKLMRQILDSSAKSKVLLKTEIQMLRSYIELEQLRFERFTYEITIADNITSEGIEIPAMIIQPFVENAIIHGILPKRDAGLLSVAFRKEDARIICTIDDNGIGREKSAGLNSGRSKEHQSHGISIAVNRLALLGKARKGEANKVVYIDKKESGIATGTTVILQIPIL